MNRGDRDELPFIHDKLRNLTISKEKRDINILLLGETGVGKSTFINAFFNYISFSTLAEAKKQKLQVVIPTQFTITDDNYQERTVKVGEDHNESIEVGSSATQACRSYVYPLEGTGLKIRLIDTPGVGDTRGIDQDNINFENVLSFIGELKHLNAICILLKPNNSRLTVMFEFCIKQLLSRLEKSASHNLIFVFTNTRSTFYRPGETLPSLKKLLSTVKGVDILCEKKNIFCTDNESFRFLAALKNNIPFESTDVNNFSQSWKQSCAECLRMIMYVVGDDTNAGLIPHDVKNTISINEARRLIVQLSQPLAEIAQLIQDNIRAVNQHKEHLRYTKTSLTELESKLYVPVIDLKVTKLDQPTTVCTSTKCSELYQVNDKKKWHYRQKCHCPCYLRNVPKEIVGTPELMNCASMNSQGECVKCSCRYQVHMHIYYETKTFQNKLEDAQIKTKILTKDEGRLSAHQLTLKLSARLSQLERERETIIKTTAKFACFLKTNAISPYNDAYEAYLQYLIDREKSMNEVSDMDLIKQLERMLSEYIQEKNTILTAIAQPNIGNTLITADDIINSIQSLYSLQIVGSKIKELFQAQNRARKDENKSQRKEFVFGYKTKSKKTSRRQNNRGRGKKSARSRRNAHFSSNRPRHHDGSNWFNAYPEPGPSFRQPNVNPIYLNNAESGRVDFTVVPQRPMVDPYTNNPQNYYTSRVYLGNNPRMQLPNHPRSNDNNFPQPPSASYSKVRPPFFNPAESSTFGDNQLPPDYSVANRGKKPQTRGRGRRIARPAYHSEPETGHRRYNNRSGNRRHNLHESSSASSSSEEEYFSSAQN